MNENTKQVIYSHWYVFFITILIGILIIMWQSNINVNKQLDTLKLQSKLQESIEETEKKLADMKKREAELYPELQKKYSEYDELIKKIKIEKDKLNDINRQKIKKELDKANLNDISGQFNTYGFSNSIVSK